jgi:hypothetical protein
MFLNPGELNKINRRTHKFKHRNLHIIAVGSIEAEEGKPNALSKTGNSNHQILSYA